MRYAVTRDGGAKSTRDAGLWRVITDTFASREGESGGKQQRKAMSLVRD